MPALSFDENTSFRDISSFQEDVSATEGPCITLATAKNKSAKLVLMEHPTSFAFTGYVTIKVIRGTISVFGFNVSSGTGFSTLYDDTKVESVNVHSSNKTGICTLRTKNAVNEIMDSCERTYLLSCFYHIFRKVETAKMLTHFVTPKTVIVLIEDNNLAGKFNPMRTLFPDVFQNMYEELARTDIRCLSMKERKLAVDLVDTNYCTRQRILVLGTNIAVKSRFMQFVFNKTLSKRCKAAFFLDCDPKHSMFSPPGVMSLIEVDSPILGPPCFYGKDPIMMIYAGQCAVLSEYISNIRKLMEHFEKIQEDQAIYINLPKFCEEFHCIDKKELFGVLQPTKVIELESGERIKKKYRDFLRQIVLDTYIRLTVKEPLDDMSNVYNHMHLLTMVSYFCKNQPIINYCSVLEDMPTIRVHWDKIRIFLDEKPIEDVQRVINVLLYSFVALCHFDKSKIPNFEIKGHQYCLDSIKGNECIGFGYVREIDEVEKILYVITPVKIHELNKKMNAVVKIVMPSLDLVEDTIYSSHSRNNDSYSVLGKQFSSSILTAHENANEVTLESFDKDKLDVSKSGYYLKEDPLEP